MKQSLHKLGSNHKKLNKKTEVIKMKKIMALTLLALLVLTVTGCKKTETTPSSGITVKESTELDNDISGLDTIDQDLNTSELDTLDTDLEKVNW